MSDDPIIAEIHRIREHIWELCHGSAEEMAERQRQLSIPLNIRRFNPSQFKQQFRTGKIVKPDLNHDAPE